MFVQADFMLHMRHIFFTRSLLGQQDCCPVFNVFFIPFVTKFNVKEFNAYILVDYFWLHFTFVKYEENVSFSNSVDEVNQKKN